MSSAQQQAIQARKQSNLTFSFLCLDPDRRDAMATFYDFCRAVDDIADEPGRTNEEKRRELETWREEIEACYRNETTSLRYATQLAGIIHRFNIQKKDLLDIINGVAMDIGEPRFPNFDALRKYCYGVASAVGLVSIRIFGCTHPQTNDFAINLGYALQFTNILRDVVEDYQKMGRVYLPQDELTTFGVKETDLAAPNQHPACRKLFQLCYFRAKHFFNKARRLLPDEERKNLKAALIMAAFYEAILEKIRKRDFALDEKRIRLSKAEKLHLVWKTLRSLRKPLPQRHLPGKVAIVGAGVSGIAAAIHLGGEGFTPFLYEARSYLGGRAHSLTDAPSGLTLDNTQHIAMGCYHHFLHLCHILGVMDKWEKQSQLHVPYVSPGGRWSSLRARNLPAPLHLLTGLFGFRELSLGDKLAVFRLSFSLRWGKPPSSDMTVAQWLQSTKQTKGAIRALWEPFCLAALNESLNTASARLLYNTLRQSLFGNKEDSAILIPRVGLSEVFLPELELYLKSIGGGLETHSKITRIEADGERITALETSRGQRIEADLFVSATPWNSLRGLLPDNCSLRNKVDQIQSSPIMGIHILTPGKLFTSPTGFVGLLDSPLQWIFDKTDTLPAQYGGQHLYAVVVSAADEWLDLKSDEIVERLRAELKRFFPAADRMVITRSLVYKSRDATFSARPETETLRPDPTESGWSNFLLAGDWTNTDLPATLEGAALSGMRLSRYLDR